MLENELRAVKEENEQKDKGDKNIKYIPIDRIRPNPYQPRKNFNRSALLELADSIKEYGVLQPINVRSLASGSFELVAGERRLRAAMLAGLKFIPAIVVTVTDNDSAIIALIENLQREDLTYLEEAESYYTLLSEHGLTQEELARKVGKSQSTIANKIRILKLPPLVKKILEDNQLTERHARALLRIQDEQLQLKVVKIICDKSLNVKKSEELIDKAINKAAEGNEDALYAALMGKSKSEAQHRGQVKRVFKDIRIFVNTIKESIRLLRDSGVNAKAAQYDRGDYFEFIIRIPKETQYENTSESGARRVI